MKIFQSCWRKIWVGEFFNYRGSNSQSLPGYRDQIQEKNIFLAHSSLISSCMPVTISILAICQKGITVHTTVNLLIISDFPHTYSNTCTESFPASRFTVYCILKDSRDSRSHFLPPSLQRVHITYNREICIYLSPLDYNKVIYCKVPTLVQFFSIPT